MSEDTAPVDKLTELCAVEVLRYFGTDFPNGFAKLKWEANQRMRTDAWNTVDNAERLARYWIRIGTVSFNGNVACLSHNLYQPNNSASPVGTPNALKTSQED